jgi:hypothetical protein
MFLRWFRYRDKAGCVRLYACQLSSHRRGGKVPWGATARCAFASNKAMLGQRQDRRDMWSDLDYMLGRSPHVRRARHEGHRREGRASSMTIVITTTDRSVHRRRNGGGR